MKYKRKKLIIMMSAVLVILIGIGVVIGVSQVKKQKELEEQGIYYQNGAEAVEEWDDEDITDDGRNQDVKENHQDNDSDNNPDNNSGNDLESDNSTVSNGNTENTNTDSKKENNKNNSTHGNTAGSENAQNTASQKDDNKKDSVKVPSAGKLTYEEYISMSPEKQEEYFEKFDSEEDFFDWYRDAKEEYDKSNKGNVVEGGSLDIGDYMD